MTPSCGVGPFAVNWRYWTVADLLSPRAAGTTWRPLPAGGWVPLHSTSDDTVECIVGRVEIHRMFTLLHLCYIQNRIVRRLEEEVGLSRDVNEANRLEAMAITFKANAAPAYLADNCHLLSDAGRRPLRSHSNDIRKLLVPRTHNKLGDCRSFLAAGPRLWNDLSPGLRQPGLSFDSFRRSLKTHLFGDWSA